MRAMAALLLGGSVRGICDEPISPGDAVHLGPHGGQ